MAVANIEVANGRPVASEDILPLTVEGLAYEVGVKRIFSEINFRIEGESQS